MDQTIIRKANTKDAVIIANVHINSWKEAYSGLLQKKKLNNLHNNYHQRHLSWQ